MTTAVELVDRMIEYYDDDPSLWVQRQFNRARMVHGKVVVSYCLTGLRQKVCQDRHLRVELPDPSYPNELSRLRVAMNREATHRGYTSVESYNDGLTRTFEEIKDFLQAVRKRLL